MDISPNRNEFFSFSVENNQEIILRKATIDDAKLVYDLSNEDLVRENSINQIKIVWEEHITWLSNKLTNSNCFFLLGFTSDNQFIGQVRIDKDNNDSTIGISITKEFRGKGLSTYLLMNSAKLFFDKFESVTTITAKINKNNEPSLSTFIKAGYIFSHKETINSNEFLVFKLGRNNEV